MYGNDEIDTTAAAVTEMAALALAFGRIDRTGPQHPNGMPESDSDHTVMLAWIAPSLADLINRRVGFQKHNTHRVAAYAAVHDAVEVYAGDTPTVRISAAQLEAKAVRENMAANRLVVQFRSRLPWFAQMIKAYEAQADLDARLVRAIDKLIVKAVHLVCQGGDLLRSGFNRADFEGVAERQRDQIIAWGNDELVRRVYDELVRQVFECLDNLEGASSVTSQPPHFVNVGTTTLWLEHDHACIDTMGCPAAVAFKDFLCRVQNPLRAGRYPVEVAEDGQLIFVGEQD